MDPGFNNVGYQFLDYFHQLFYWLNQRVIAFPILGLFFAVAIALVIVRVGFRIITKG